MEKYNNLTNEQLLFQPKTTYHIRIPLEEEMYRGVKVNNQRQILCLAVMFFIGGNRI